jgi:primosomal protein N' (replication factor Y)
MSDPSTDCAAASCWGVPVAVELPQHGALGSVLDYASEQPIAVGSLVWVPLGRREVLGIVCGDARRLAPADAQPALRPVKQVLSDLPALSDHWLALIDFAASYYQRAFGELAVSVFPPELRKLDGVRLQRRLQRLRLPDAPARLAEAAQGPPAAPQLTDEQAAVVQAARCMLLSPNPRAMLLFGATGSGKTEVYLQAVESATGQGRQSLVMVPEINLTPQLEARFTQRFAGRTIVSMHSGLTPAQRLRAWLLAHLGVADVVLGTRLAVFASMPRLGLIIVDEEHDPSYKSQDGARYSARDMAVWRGRREALPVILGSATPSLESWNHAQAGRYDLAQMPSRIGAGTMPRVRLIDMNLQPKGSASNLGVSPPLLDALQSRLARGEQSLVFLNRRGYAPVLFCGDCGWKSGCPHCSAWRVFHKLDRTLRCHHCGFTQAVPRACPDCGNLDISPVGRGTERLEEQLASALKRPDGSPARVLRMDADSSRLKGALSQQLAQVHSGDVDVLVGTQMITKGHDFRRITLVAAVNPDGALFSSDFRASERLFALLMQAAGRAGREAAHAASSEMWIQTWHPQHRLYQSLRQFDYPGYAAAQLQEREAAAMPPFAHLALLRAEARSAIAATAFLNAAADALRHDEAAQPWLQAVMLYPPVPTPVAKVADVERMQMLLEATSRSALQRLLNCWLPHLHAIKASRKGAQERVLRWALDVDPSAI